MSADPRLRPSSSIGFNSYRTPNGFGENMLSVGILNVNEQEMLVLQTVVNALMRARSDPDLSQFTVSMPLRMRLRTSIDESEKTRTEYDALTQRTERATRRAERWGQEIAAQQEKPAPAAKPSPANRFSGLDLGDGTK